MKIRKYAFVLLLVTAFTYSSPPPPTIHLPRLIFKLIVLFKRHFESQYLVPLSIILLASSQCCVRSDNRPTRKNGIALLIIIQKWTSIGVMPTNRFLLQFAIKSVKDYTLLYILMVVHYMYL